MILRFRSEYLENGDEFVDLGEILEGQVWGRVKSSGLLVQVLLEPWERWLWISVVDLGPGLKAQ